MGRVLTPECQDKETLNKSGVHPVPAWRSPSVLFLDDPTVDPSHQMPENNVVETKSVRQFGLGNEYCQKPTQCLSASLRGISCSRVRYSLSMRLV
jgi:hypothetical protein